MTPAREMTDQDLIRAYVDSNDVDSLGVFLCRYERLLVRFVANFLRDEAVAQDIVQETFLRCLRHRHQYPAIERVSNWLYTIAGNLDHKEAQGFALKVQLLLREPQVTPEQKTKVEAEVKVWIRSARVHGHSHP